MNPILTNFFVNGPNFFVFAAFILALVMNHKIGYVYIIVSIISEGLNYGLKHIIKQKRPDGAKDCHDYVTCGEPSESYGMPSGHAQSMGLTLSFWLLYIWNNKQNKHRTIETTKNIVGKTFVNPLVVFKNPFAEIPSITAKTK